MVRQQHGQPRAAASSPAGTSTTGAAAATVAVMRAAAAAVAVATWVPAAAVAEAAAAAAAPTGVGRVPPLAAAGCPNGGGGGCAASGPSLGFQLSHARAPMPLEDVSRDSSPSRQGGAGSRDRDKHEHGHPLALHADGENHSRRRRLEAPTASGGLAFAAPPALPPAAAAAAKRATPPSCSLRWRRRPAGANLPETSTSSFLGQSSGQTSARRRRRRRQPGSGACYVHTASPQSASPVLQLNTPLTRTPARGARLLLSSLCPPGGRVLSAAGGGQGGVTATMAVAGGGRKTTAGTGARGGGGARGGLSSSPVGGRPSVVVGGRISVGRLSAAGSREGGGIGSGNANAGSETRNKDSSSSSSRRSLGKGLEGIRPYATAAATSAVNGSGRRSPAAGSTAGKGAWTGRAKFAGRGGAGGRGGIRSGGVMAQELRPLLDMLDDARGHRATGAAAMKVLDAAAKAGWEKIRFSALRMGKIAAGAAVAGRWETHGRPLVLRMGSLGVPEGDVSSWTAVLLPLSRLGCADECLEVLEIMEGAVGVTTAAATATPGVPHSGGRNGSAAPTGGEKRALGTAPRGHGMDFFHDLDRRNELLTVAHNHCMFAFIKAGRHEEAVKHFDTYFRRPQPSDVASWTHHRTSTTGEGSGTPWDGSEPDPRGGVHDESVLSPDIFSYTHLMSSLQRLGRDRACLSALYEMRARGIKADTYTYVTAMKAVGAAGQWEIAVSLLAELRELEGVSPDVYVYTAAISACSTAGRWEEALDLEGEMRRRGIKPNAYTVTSCISALARGGEWERAVQELIAAEEGGLPVSTPAYNAALKAFAIGKALQPGLDFFRRMQEEGRVPLDEQTHNIAIELCKECGDTSTAVGILRAMEGAGFPPSVVSYNTALGACEVAGDYRLSLRLLREMKQRRRGGGDMVNGEGKEDRSARRIPSQRGRTSPPLSPDLWTFNTALGACARAGEWEAVEDLLEEMDNELGQSSSSGSSSGSSSSGRRTGGIRKGTVGGDLEVDEMLHEMGGGAADGGISRPASRNFITFATLIMAADAGGQPRRCLEHYAEMGLWGLAPNAPVYEAVARACLASRSWRWATLVHRDAVTRQSAVAWTACAAAVAMMATGKVKHAVRVLEGARVDDLLGGGEDEDNDTYDTLSAAAGHAMKAMSQAGDWTGAARLFDSLLDSGAVPSMQLMVLYIRAQAATASSTPPRKSSKPGDDKLPSPPLTEQKIGPNSPTTTTTTTTTTGGSPSSGDASEPGDGVIPSPVFDVRGDDFSASPGLAALLALRRLDGLGLEPGANEHTAVLFACADSGKSGGPAALAVLRSLQEKGLRCNGRAAAMVLSSLSKSEDWEGAAKVADELEACGVTHTGYSATAAISAYGRVGRWEDAVDVLETLLDDDDSASTAVTTAVFNAGIMACARAGQLEEGMFLLREMWAREVSRDVQTYNTAMALCKSAGEWTRAVGLLEAMEADGVAADAVTFNTVIAACEAGADHWTAFSLFNQMERAGLTPDLWTYNSLANVLGSCGEWERAVALLDDMRARGLRPDVITYSALVSACEKAGQVEGSLSLLEEMAREGVDANERTFSAAIKSISSASSFSSPSPSSSSSSSETKPSASWQKVAKLHEEARRRGKANVVTYSAAISACAKEKRWRDALALLAEMRRDGIEPNDYSFSAAMWACVNADEGKRALQLFATIMDVAPAATSSTTTTTTSRATGGADTHTVDSLSAAVPHAGSLCDGDDNDSSSPRNEDGSDARGVVAAAASAAPGRGVARSRDCYMAAISACHKEEDFPRALALLKHMRRKGVRGSLGLYNLVLSMCERHGDAETSKKLLTLMRMDRVSPSVVSCNQVIRACEKAGRWEDALAILMAMVSGGISPNVYTVCSALRACCIGHSPQRAVVLLKELRGIMGTALGLPVYNTLVCSFHRDGRYDLADFFYKEAYREGAVSHWQQEQQEQQHQQQAEQQRQREQSPPPPAVPEPDGVGIRGGSVPGRGPEDCVPGVKAGVMDLHGHSLPLAHAAVRCALVEVWRFSQREGTALGDLTIITGMGRGSLHAFQPIIRPEVQRMLTDEFYPPLDSATEVGNTGRVVVSAKTIEAWLDHNVEAKRPVMARLAAALQKKASVAAAAAEKPRPEEGRAVDAGASPPQETQFGPSKRQLEPQQQQQPPPPQQQQQQEQFTRQGLLEPQASPPSSLSGAMPAPAPPSAPSLTKTDQVGSGDMPGHGERGGGGSAANDGGVLGSSEQEGRWKSGEARPATASTTTKPTPNYTRSTVPRELRSAVPKDGRIRNGGNSSSSSSNSGGGGSGSAANGATGRGGADGGAARDGVSRESSNKSSNSSGSSRSGRTISGSSSSSSSGGTDGVVAPSRIVMPSGRGVRAAGTRASPESGRPRRRRSMAQAEAGAADVESGGER